MPGKLRRIQEFNEALRPVAAFRHGDPTDRMLLRLAVKAMSSTGELNETEKAALGRLMGGRSVRDVEAHLRRGLQAEADALNLDEVMAFFPRPGHRQALLRFVGHLGQVDANLDSAEFAFWTALERRVAMDLPDKS